MFLSTILEAPSVMLVIGQLFDDQRADIIIDVTGMN